MMRNRYFNPESVPRPGGNFSHGAEHPPGSRVLYTAGQVGMAPDGTVPDDYLEQIGITWQNLRRVLDAAGMTVDDIIRVNHFLTISEDIFPYDARVFEKHLGSIKPAATLVVISGLAAPEFKIEVEIIAAAASSSDPAGPALRFFNPDTMSPPIGKYSHGAEVAAGARTLQTAGQVGAADDGTVPNDFAAQAENTLRNLLGVLASDGMGPADIAKLRVFLTDIADLGTYREIRANYLGDACCPATTAVAVSALAMPELKIEIEAIAAKA